MARRQSVEPRWDELALEYARLGVKSWNRRDRATRKAAKVALAIDIAEDEYTASEVVKKPFRAGTDKALVLIPMPMPEGRELAFFAPVDARRSDGAVAYDLALVVDECRHAVGFRLEPADIGADQSHGYDHVQLNVAMGHRTAPLARTATWLPDSYPAFPLRSSGMRDRFLAMTLAMHGFPQHVVDVVNQVAKRHVGLVEDCLTRIDGLIGRGRRSA